MLDRIIAYLLWHRVKPLLRLDERQRAWDLLISEVSQTHAIITGAIIYHRTATQVLADRLTKRFDLGLAMNEAAQAAQKHRRDIDPTGGLTARQMAALEFQRKDLTRRINGGSPPNITDEGGIEYENALREAERVLKS